MKMITLKQFVEREGSQEHAAQKIGVTSKTVFRWLHGKSEPDPLAQERLKSLGIKV